MYITWTPTCNETLLNNKKGCMLPGESIPKWVCWMTEAPWEHTYGGLKRRLGYCEHWGRDLESIPSTHTVAPSHISSHATRSQVFMMCYYLQNMKITPRGSEMLRGTWRVPEGTNCYRTPFACLLCALSPMLSHQDNLSFVITENLVRLWYSSLWVVNKSTKEWSTLNNSSDQE